jgi:isopenicillin N synthase-like dioxygenase
MSFTAVPVLDLAKANDPVTKPGLLEQLRHALMEVGFLYIQNTTISNELLEQVKAAGRAVFDIPEEEK